MSLFDVVVQPIGLDPGPDTAFVAVAPPIQPLNILVPIPDWSICPVTRMVYALWMSWVREPHDNRQDLVAAFRSPWSCDVQSLDVARVDGLDDLPSGLGVLCPDRFDDLRHGSVRKVPTCAEKEVEYLSIGAEKGVAVFINEIAVCGNADCAFPFGGGLRLAGIEMVDGEC